jgi:hypothetical protein
MKKRLMLFSLLAAQCIHVCLASFFSGLASRSLVPLAILLLVVSVAAAQVPLAQHVILVVEANRSFSSAYPTGMPWLEAIRLGLRLYVSSIQPELASASHGCRRATCGHPPESRDITLPGAHAIPH